MHFFISYRLVTLQKNAIQSQHSSNDAVQSQRSSNDAVYKVTIVVICKLYAPQYVIAARHGTSCPAHPEE
jgi:hypothetical protein